MQIWTVQTLVCLDQRLTVIADSKRGFENEKNFLIDSALYLDL